MRGTAKQFWREIAAVLIAKVILLTLLWWACFATKPVVPKIDSYLFAEQVRR